MIKFSPKYFILPLIALIVIGSLPAPADSGRSTSGACGPALTSNHSLRSAFEQFERGQSAAASKVCAAYRNDMASVVLN